jgi:VanZ family protein
LDKLEHIGIYAVLSCLLGYWLRFKDWKFITVVLIYLLLLLLAGLDEYHQRFISVGMYLFMILWQIRLEYHRFFVFLA